MKRPPRESLLATLYGDGRAHRAVFVAPHVLEIHQRAERGPLRAMRVDLRASTVAELDAPDAGASDGQLGYCDVLGDLAAASSADGKAVELRSLRGARLGLPRARASWEEGNAELREAVRARGKLVRSLTRAGRHPMVRFADAATLFTAAGEVLKRWDVASGRCVKNYRGHGSALLAARTDRLVAAQGGEGVWSFFDAATAERLVSLRVARDGHLAFDDGGCFDASDGFARGVELTWTDARSTAFVPGVGFGVLPFNELPMRDVRAATGGATPGLLALRTAGRW